MGRPVRATGKMRIIVIRALGYWTRIRGKAQVARALKINGTETELRDETVEKSKYYL